MSTPTVAEPRRQKKRGPRPKGFVRFNLMLDPTYAEWAMEQPEGLSALLRRLLERECKARTVQPHHTTAHSGASEAS